jgi:hypothetical protein
MNNLWLILIMFFVAALNTFVVIMAVRFIVKIKTNKQDITGQIKKDLLNEQPKAEANVLKKPEAVQNITPVKPETKEKKEVPEKIELQPKFLKYTSEGYINPKSEIGKKEHIWR